MKFIVSEKASPVCCITTIEESRRAAEILCSYFNKITGADFSISEKGCDTGTVIFELTEKYGDSGFSYEINEGNLHIGAKNEQAFVYAVYDLLERCALCRYYSKDYEYIPHNADLELDIEPYSIEPELLFREVYYKGYEEKEYAEKLKMATSGKHDGWGFWCHSFQKLIPNAEYFNDHPEYFALIDGKRQPKGEPCLSNPEVKKIVIQNLKKFMDENPECKYWSISQNDDNMYCRCPECAKKDEVDGGPMGSILNFVNDVAREFPDKIISTLAYWYSRKAPKVTRPEKNVHIMLCNIEANRGMPIEIDPRNEGTRQELLDWAKICGNVSLWDYCIQFANLVSPFPNLRVIGPNIRFFVENNVRMLFSQCNREIGGEFSDLRGYMLSKLMWEPSCDEMAIMEDFCNGYYEKASPYILKYIDMMHDALEETGGTLGIFQGPKDARGTYLTPELYGKYQELFDDAENAVKDDDAVLLRVKTARMPLYYAGIVLEYGNVNERMEMIRKFAATARKTNLQKVEEWKITVDQFVTDSLAALQ